MEKSDSSSLLGLGTVGTGVYKVLKSQKEEMIPKLGSEIEINKSWFVIWKRQHQRLRIQRF